MFNIHLHKWRAQWIFTKYTHFLSWSMAQWWWSQWQPTPVLLPGKSHGQRSLVGCSPWGRWGLDTTERLHFHFSLSCIGEENGNPLQCSCLENPRDGGAWWASVYGVTQSRTRLKRLSIVEMSYNTKEAHENEHPRTSTKSNRMNLKRPTLRHIIKTGENQDTVLNAVGERQPAI